MSKGLYTRCVVCDLSGVMLKEPEALGLLPEPVDGLACSKCKDSWQKVLMERKLEAFRKMVALNNAMAQVREWPPSVRDIFEYDPEDDLRFVYEDTKKSLTKLIRKSVEVRRLAKEGKL